MHPSRYIIRFDDITPGMAWSKFLPLKKELEGLGVKSILGVVPECLDESLTVETVDGNFFDYIRRWQGYGDAILQHGTHHLYKTTSAGILKINNNSEFSGCSYKEQYQLLKKGKNILESEKCWQPYFMAPSHSFDKNTLKALSDLGFVSISDGYGFFPYKMLNIILVPQLFSKPFRLLPGISTICIHINNMDDSEIKKILLFVKENKESFVDFKKIINTNVATKNFSLLRIFSGLVIKSIRLLRSL